MNHLHVKAKSQILRNESPTRRSESQMLRSELWILRDKSQMLEMNHKRLEVIIIEFTLKKLIR